MRKRQILLLGSLFLSVAVQAQTVLPLSVESTSYQQSTANNPDQATAYRGLSVNKEDMTSDQREAKTNLTKAQQHTAQVWGLTPQQMQRYVFLMQNKSGVYYGKSTLTPVQVLGINARNDAERQHYATLAVQQAKQRFAKELAFNALFSQTFREETKGLPRVKPFDYEKFSPLKYKPIVLQTGDQLQLFLAKGQSVSAIMSVLVADLKHTEKTKLNVYFVGKDVTEKSVQTWARKLALPPALVKEGRLTLNLGSKASALLKQAQLKSSDLPLLVLVRDGKASLVNTGRF